MAGRIGVNAATLAERMMRERPHSEQGYRSAMGIIALARCYQRDRLEAACERALVINAISYSSVSAILKSGLDRASPAAEPIKATPLQTIARNVSFKADKAGFTTIVYRSDCRDGRKLLRLPWGLSVERQPELSGFRRDARSRRLPISRSDGSESVLF